MLLFSFTEFNSHPALLCPISLHFITQPWAKVKSQLFMYISMKERIWHFLSTFCFVLFTLYYMFWKQYIFNTNKVYVNLFGVTTFGIFEVQIWIQYLTLKQPLNLINFCYTSLYVFVCSLFSNVELHPK